jgi:hypothetical protein
MTVNRPTRFDPIWSIGCARLRRLHLLVGELPEEFELAYRVFLDPPEWYEGRPHPWIGKRLEPGADTPRSVAAAMRRAVGVSRCAWMSADSTASSGSRDACAASVTFGTVSGPMMCCRNTVPLPTSIGWPAQRAMARRGVETTTRNGHRWRARAFIAYCGQLYSFWSSRRSCASTMTPSTGWFSRASSTIASAKCSTGAGSWSAMSLMRASVKCGSGIRNSASSSGTNAGRSRTRVRTVS